VCSILGFSGKMPKGLLTRMLIRAELRGRDSVGLAYRLEGRNVSYRMAESASVFVADKDNSGILSEARRSLRGIAHTRRASPGMPINDRNAHPFTYWRYIFAHNGKVVNWLEIKSRLIEHFEQVAKRLEEAGETAKAETAKYCVKYSRAITTDSMVLGPYIETRDFQSIAGCMGLVWMRENNVYTLRYAKEAVASTIIWRYLQSEDGEPADDQVVTIVASTPYIIQAMEKVDNIEFDMGSMIEFDQGKIYRVEPMGLECEGSVPMKEAIVDQYSSEAVEDVKDVEIKVAGQETASQEAVT
jgi:predicted glutamine amidotransferase